MVAPTVIITGRIRSMRHPEERVPAVRPFVHIFDEVEHTNDVAYNDADETRYSRKAMKPGVPMMARAIMLRSLHRALPQKT